MYFKGHKGTYGSIHLIVISLHCTLHKAAADLGDYPIYVHAHVFPLVFFLSLCGCGMSILNNELKYIWLRKLLGFVWEAGIQVVELYLQSSVMSLEGRVAMGRPQDPHTPVLSHRKFTPGCGTGNKLRSFSVSSRMLPTRL